ncbi:MAG: radical SAM protein, partial [Candidatus Omnitrophota bacterium]|nr:radical SAM protein [Candidatus Omnitrophota bacterium]
TLQSELVDYVVWGEGENSLPELLDCIYNKTSCGHIKGIGYKDNGKSVLTGLAPYTDLDGVFELPYKLLNMDKYARKMMIGLDNCHAVFTSRGCPFRCKFCSNSSRIWPNTKMRYHSIEHILNDVSKLVNNYGADGITFADECLFVEEQRLVAICQALVEANFKVKYRTSARVDLLFKLKASTWELLKRAGFVGISIGIESGSQRMLDLMGKGITLEQIEKVDSLLTKYKFYKTFNFMTCLPTEMVDDVKLTLKLILKLAENSRYCPYPFGTLHKYIPLPGTELYDLSVRHGFSPPCSVDGWTQFDFKNVSETHKTVRPWLSDEMIDFVGKANELIEGLNVLFLGAESDQVAISRKIKEIEFFIADK